MGLPNIEATPVVATGSPVPVEVQSRIVEPSIEVFDGDESGGEANEGGEKPAEGESNDEKTVQASDTVKPAEGGDADTAVGEKPAEDADAKAAETDTGAAQKELDKNTSENKRRFVQLQKEDSQLTKERKALKADQKQLKADQEATRGKVEAYDQAQELAKTDPVALLKALGLTYEGVTTAVLNGKDGDSKVANIEQELAEMKKASEDEKTAQANKEKLSRQAEQQSQLKAYKDRLVESVDKEDGFALLKLQGTAGIDVAVKSAAVYFNTNGKLPDDAELLKATESFLREQAVERIGEAKVNALLEPKLEKTGEEKPAEETPKKIEEKPAEKKTLSNKLNSEGGTRKPQVLDRDASIAEAAKTLLW